MKVDKIEVLKGDNDSISSNIADALFYASDHLPVIADFKSIKSE